jgi:Flp pilus assembly protein TadD
MTTKSLGRRVSACFCAGALWWAAHCEWAGAAETAAQPAPATVVELEGNVEAQSKGTTAWNPARASQWLDFGDYLRTLQSSKATIRSGSHSLVRMDRLSLVEVLPPRNSLAHSHLELVHGSLHLLHRDQPSELELETPFAAAAIEGTDFTLSVDDANVTTLTMLDGRASLMTAQGSIELSSGEQGIAEAGRPPRKTAVINAINVVQWSLYYPGVLDPEELKLDATGGSPWAASLAAYRSGDLVQGLDRFPKGALNASAAQRLYYAALLLAVGDVTNCEARLRQEPDNPLARALGDVIAAVKNEVIAGATGGSSPSQLVGFSYYQQSRHDLEGALKTAQRAVGLSTNFAFGWERVAELEFSFGRVSEAERALERALELAPRNPQAHALRGFLLAADNRIGAAIVEFDTALKIDANLANAWLGRGLCRIKEGQAQTGFQDLQIAAALEPTRSLLRSYLGKAFINGGDDGHAHQELALAQRLDDKDPTPWLYLSLLDYQENRTSQAVDDLQQAEDLNTNRQVYRSKLLLDRDRAVASTSLAKIYQDAGMNEVSVAEASRAVDYDYANYSAHLFLAESYDALRDPTRFNLRYETAWFNELLLANLLAPVGARPISQNISQQEYSRLLEQDGLGLDSTSQYCSDRQLQEVASQYGAYGSTSYSLDLTYQHNDGILHPNRPNNDLSDIEWYSQIKQQLGPNDAVTLLTKYENYHSGDNFQYNNVTNASPYFRYNEYETPILVGAWHHEWEPGVHSLFMAGRLVDDQTFTSKDVSVAAVLTNTEENVGYRQFTNFSDRIQFQIYTLEFNQLFQGERHTSILGVRYQTGHFNTQDLLSGVINNMGAYSPPVETNVVSGFRRISAYGYHTWEIFPRFLLTAGVTYDAMTYPADFRSVPITAGEAQRLQLSPKLALTWTPLPAVTFRGAFAESLSGATFDESFTLEPTQIAGFIQEYRSIISESLVGSVAGARDKIWGGAMDLKLPGRTFLTVQGQWLGTDLNEGAGVFDSGANGPTAGSMPEHFRYAEPSLDVTINKLVGNDFSIGAAYRYTHSTLSVSDPFVLALSPLLNTPAQLEAQLHEADAYLQFAHPSGFFARADVEWHLQFNSGYSPGTVARPAFDLPSPRTEFTQVNLYAGYRFWHRRGEATFGVLNVGGRNYSLNPLNVYAELPRSRVWMGRLRFNF